MPQTRSMPDIRKAGRLGNDRPSLEARLGVGLSKPWGVWEGGFDERLGRPPAGYLINTFSESGLLISPLNLFKNLSLVSGTSLIEVTLTNALTLRHLHYCISTLGSVLDLPVITAYCLQQIDRNQHAGSVSIPDFRRIFSFSNKLLAHRTSSRHMSPHCK